MDLSVKDANTWLGTIAASLSNALKGKSVSLVNASTAAGKIYELECLAELCNRIVHPSPPATPRYTLRLVGDTCLQFRSKGGPIDHAYTHFKVLDADTEIAEVWTDLYFDTLSAATASISDYSGYHELDIAITAPNLLSGSKPIHDQVFVACECKDTSFKKDFVRTILGLRRELSLLTRTRRQERFDAELGRCLQSDPPSRIYMFCSDPKTEKYSQAPAYFDITVEHL